jgi:hypothetical protein
MNIVDRAAAFVQSLEALSRKTAWDWRRSPRCGKGETTRYGTYTVHPWFLDGRREVVIQRHSCRSCRKTYSESSPHLVRGSWYAREVHRYSVDLWQHGRTSLRRGAEFVRSLLGRQERFQLWRLFAPEPAERSRFSKSTLYRWLDLAGEAAKGTVKGQLEGAKVSGEVGVDGLWAKLQGGTKRVVLVLVDSVTGLIYPPVVVEGEEDEASWRRLFGRAQRAGLSRLRGVTSDGVMGVLTGVGSWGT